MILKKMLTMIMTLPRSITPTVPLVMLEAVKLMAAVCLVPPDGHDKVGKKRRSVDSRLMSGVNLSVNSGTMLNVTWSRCKVRNSILVPANLVKLNANNEIGFQSLQSSLKPSFSFRCYLIVMQSNHSSRIFLLSLSEKVDCHLQLCPIVGLDATCILYRYFEVLFEWSANCEVGVVLSFDLFLLFSILLLAKSNRYTLLDFLFVMIPT